jgi:hypothetical protein
MTAILPLPTDTSDTAPAEKPLVTILDSFDQIVDLIIGDDTFEVFVSGRHVLSFDLRRSLGRAAVSVLRDVAVEALAGGEQ